MKKHLLLSSLAVIVILASCKKEDTPQNTSASIDGSYKLKYITANTNSIVTVSDGEKTITKSDYTSTNNQGIINFNNSTLTATGLSYTVATEAKGYIYFGADLIDSVTYPFSVTLPASNSVAPYQLIGADSIYFPQGSLTTGIGGSGASQSGPSGGRYSLAGNLLTITQHYAKDSTFNISGDTYHQQNVAIASIVMEKQ